MKKFGLVFCGFVLGAMVMIVFIPRFSLRGYTVDTMSRVPGAQTTSSSSSSVFLQTTAQYSVLHIVDGDTIDVQAADGVVQRVRFIGIDTPETVDSRKNVQCYGTESSDRMKVLLSGKSVTLVSKPDEDTDSYGRLLRYVFLGEEDIGSLMLREGYAVSLCKKFPHPKCDSYDALEQKARSLQLGRWAACAK